MKKINHNPKSKIVYNPQPINHIFRTECKIIFQCCFNKWNKLCLSNTTKNYWEFNKATFHFISVVFSYVIC